MSKVVRAVNVMISNANKIDNCVRNNDEYFFEYDGKYKWSMSYNDSENVYYLYFYPGDGSIKELAYAGPEEWEHINMVRYSSGDFKGAEAHESFRELYTLLKEKVYGIDKALDDIISSEDLPF